MARPPAPLLREEAFGTASKVVDQPLEPIEPIDTEAGTDTGYPAQFPSAGAICRGKEEKRLKDWIGVPSCFHSLASSILVEVLKSDERQSQLAQE
jgi:hypothetical protein